MAVGPTEIRGELGAFVPADVRAAIRDGAQRREIGEGSVLIADVSGFTPLTQALARRHGARRGAEEVAALLNRVYGALVTEVDRAAGSVVEFAGDAVCCCFDGDDGSSALRCGLRMQASMAGLRAGGVLAEVTVAIATGPFRRLGVGDPALRVYEVVAGPAVDRVSAIAAHAGRGEVLVDGATADALGERLVLVGRRGHAGDRCAAVDQVIGASPPDAPPPPDLDAGLARPWVPAGIYDRLREDDLLVGELRSVVALFAGFSGIDYAATDAGQRLDAYVRFAQTTIARFGGTVFTVTVDDKGSYLCAGFGAPVAHDNDPQRAAAAALALVAPPQAAGGVQPAGIGMTRGRMYAGTYGGATRRTFGLQGTRTNLAARLMQAAAPDQILVDEPLAALLQSRYELRALPALRVKGHTSSVASRALVGARQAAGRAAAAPVLVNRFDERARIEDLLRALLDGEGGVVLLEGEPGIGKSRLVRHLAERAAEMAIAVHSGAGDPIERGDPYHGWRMVFGGDLGLESLPDELSGEARAEAARDLLTEQLASVAADSPTLVVLEDAHWLDSASLALATRIATAPGRLALVVTTRPLAEAGHAELERLAATAGCERIRIGPLAAAEVRALAAGAAGVDLPATVATLIESKAGGNPLFTRELALALRDRGLLAGAARRGLAALGEQELESPDSVEAVIASRVDRLAPRAQAVIKVGSVLGRTFSAGALRTLAGDDADVQLAVLEELELLGHTGEDHALEFRHAVIRDVVYERLLYAQRRDLHRRAAEYLERAGTDAAGGATDAALAHHWERAEVPDRAARRFASAGEAAFRAGAFRECVDMLERALTLSRDELPDAPRARWQWQIAQSCYRLGELELCHRMAGEAIAGLDRALPVGAPRLAAATVRELLCQVAYRALPRGLPRRAAAAECARLRLAVESQRIMAEVYYLASDKARSSYAAVRSLNLAERLGPSVELAECYGAMCVIAGVIGVHGAAEHYGTLARRTAERLGDDFAIAITLHQHCMYRSSKGPYGLFAADYERSIAGFRRLGHKPRLRDALGIAAIADHLFGRPEAAERRMRELLATVEPQESSLQSTWAHAWIGTIALRRGQPQEALERLRLAAGLLQVQALDMTSINVHGMTALALRRCGRDVEARDEEDAAWELVRRFGRRPTGHAVLDGYGALTELALARWDEARSPRERRHAVQRAREAGRILRAYERMFAIGSPARWLYEGELQWRLGQRERALQAWQRSRARAAELDMRYELALAHAALGDHLPAGSAQRVRHRALAGELLRELGVPPQTRAVTPRPPADEPGAR